MTLRDIGIGYTLATGSLYCDLGEFHAFAEWLLNRPILTHEFARDDTWRDLRTAFEQRVKDGVLDAA